MESLWPACYLSSVRVYFVVGLPGQGLHAIHKACTVFHRCFAAEFVLCIYEGLGEQQRAMYIHKLFLSRSITVSTCGDFWATPVCKYLEMRSGVCCGRQATAFVHVRPVAEPKAIKKRPVAENGLPK